MDSLIRIELPPATPACNCLGRPFWVFENEWGDDWAEADDLGCIRAIYEHEGLPYREQFFPAPAPDDSPLETWWSHPSLTAEQRN